MQRWNGWGDDRISMDLTADANAFMLKHLGRGNAQNDALLSGVLQGLPASRIKDHPLISTEPFMRLEHAHGQSLPDWIRLRYGTIDRIPDGVAQPQNEDELAQVLTYAQEQNMVVIPYGGGTSVVGHLDIPREESRPVLTLSMGTMRRLLDLDSTSRMATFEAGVRGPDLEAQLRNHGFTLGHFPQSFEYSTLGGWVVTRSSGQQSAFFGRMEDLFVGGEMITPKGSLVLPVFPASAAGPDLRHLVLGSEGRLGILSTATVKIQKIPAQDAVFGMFFPSFDVAEKAVSELAGSGLPYSMIRLSNPLETQANIVLGGRPKDVKRLRVYLKIRRIDPDDCCLCLAAFTGTGSLTSKAIKAGLAGSLV